MSIPSSFRVFSPKVPQTIRLQIPVLKTLIPSTSIPSKFPLFSSISIQRLPTKPVSASPSSSSSSLQSIEELPPKLQEIVKLFQAVQEPKMKYEQLMFYGRGLTPLAAQFKTNENKVQGCVSQVWVRAYLDPDKNVRFEADSDSVLTKGLAALLVQGLSGNPAPEILKVSPDFVTLLGLQQSLTPSRNNGFLNMLKLMQKKALQLYIESQESNGSSLRADSQVESVGTSGIGGAEANSQNSMEGTSGISGAESNSEVGGENLKPGTDEVDETESNGRVGLGSRGERIREKLDRMLRPIELEIEDISHQHAGHKGVGGRAGETHYNVRIVSKEFEGKSLVKRHRLIYELLQEELQTGLHALSIVAKTPSEVSGR
ncbi:PREDICTED: sufE-like protein 1, chloroplastic/mitochondrial [Nelumbo nucifera]|uniref:SufE-like protein 1, chloroplastic/mitochondrial n=2 Tax=Nelumbo nucifera TaxID=4432 RepID=A0A1U8A154_NELNU|nr:PREDICTED: sufE-like protein 1, chloroplastic/mitochondrial [Nelumbo nucifera]DAD27727.1 TPA_asm: hypothetical protein HUJ06_029195 [Nelumbo nucifera]